jgi:hypothetical protein
MHLVLHFHRILNNNKNTAKRPLLELSAFRKQDIYSHDELTYFADMEGSSSNIVCDKCGKTFHSRTSLNDPINRLLGTGPYKLQNVCGKTFYSRANRKR